MLLSSAYTHVRIANSNRIDLGNGFYFKDRTNPKFADDSSEHELWKEGEDKRIGYLSTFVYPEIGHTIGHIRVEPEWRGRYLGEKMVKALVQLYGSLGSDPQGNTSPAAISMWKRLGAEEIPTDKNTKGFFYILRR